MRVVILAFDGFNEIDSFVAPHALNRLSSKGWRAELVGPSPAATQSTHLRSFLGIRKPQPLH